MQITNAIKGKANEEQRRKENIDMSRRSQKIAGKVKRWDRRTDYKKRFSCSEYNCTYI